MQVAEERKKSFLSTVITAILIFVAVCCFTDKLGAVGLIVYSKMALWFGASKNVAAVALGVTVILRWKNDRRWMLIDLAVVIVMAALSRYYSDNFGTVPKLIGKGLAKNLGAGMLNYIAIFFVFLVGYVYREYLMAIYADIFKHTKKGR